MNLRNKVVRRVTATVSLALVLSYAQCSFAQEFSYLTSLAVGQSDNIRRSASIPESETIASAGLQFALDQRSSRLTADVLGEFGYNEYLGNAYDSELLGNLIGDAHFSLIPQRLEWTVSDNFGQVLSDPFIPATPDNRENINYFFTGPDLTLAFGSATRVRFGGRYSMTNYEVSQLDADSFSEQFSLIRLLSERSTISLNVIGQQVEYEQVSGANYDQQDAYLSYAAEGGRTQLSVDAGYTLIDPQNSSRDDTGALLRLKISRRASTASIVTLDAGREFLNSGSAFALTQNAGGVGLAAAQGSQTTQPFVADHAILGWTFARHRTGLLILASWVKRTYKDNPILDQTLNTLSGLARRDMARNASVSLNAGYSNARFDQPGGRYDEWTAGVSYIKRLTERVTLNASLAHFDRSGEFRAGNFNENRVTISLGYGRGDPRTRLMQPAFGVDLVQSDP